MPEGPTTIAIQQLLDRLAAGDESAKNLLVSQAMDRLMIIARKLLRSFGGEKRVELWSTDVVDEAYPRFAKALDDVKPKSPLQFFGLARLQMHRVLLDKVRGLKKSRELVDGGQSLEVGTPDNERQRMLLLDLLEAVGTLPETQANTVWLKLSGYTHREIGEFLGVHHDTVDNYWNRACVKLAHLLQPYMELRGQDSGPSP